LRLRGLNLRAAAWIPRNTPATFTFRILSNSSE
jgi:hypothetical protein